MPAPLDRATRLAAARASHRQFLAAVRELPMEDWNRPSRAPGWSVHDVVAHQASSFSGLFGGFALRAVATDDIESENDRAVDRRRTWSREAVLDEYTTWQPRAVRAVALATAPGVRRARARVGELGWLPLALLPSGMVFDSDTHLRHDIAPVVGLDVPPLEPLALRASIEWMVAIAANLATTAGGMLGHATVELRFVGSVHERWVLVGRGGRVRAGRRAALRPPAWLTVRADTFARWVTRRSAWRDEDVEVGGDLTVATAAADELRVV